MKKHGRSDASAPTSASGLGSPTRDAPQDEKALAIPLDALGPSCCAACGQWFVSIKRPDLAAYCSDRCRYRDGKRKERARRLVPLMLRGEDQQVWG